MILYMHGRLNINENWEEDIFKLQVSFEFYKTKFHVGACTSQKLNKDQLSI